MNAREKGTEQEREQASERASERDKANEWNWLKSSNASNKIHLMLSLKFFAPNSWDALLRNSNDRFCCAHIFRARYASNRTKIAGAKCSTTICSRCRRRQCATMLADYPNRHVHTANKTRYEWKRTRISRIVVWKIRFNVHNRYITILKCFGSFYSLFFLGISLHLIRLGAFTSSVPISCACKQNKHNVGLNEHGKYGINCHLIPTKYRAIRFKRPSTVCESASIVQLSCYDVRQKVTASCKANNNNSWMRCVCALTPKFSKGKQRWSEKEICNETTTTLCLFFRNAKENELWEESFVK